MQSNPGMLKPFTVTLQPLNHKVKTIFLDEKSSDIEFGKSESCSPAFEDANQSISVSKLSSFETPGQYYLDKHNDKLFTQSHKIKTGGKKWLKSVSLESLPLAKQKMHILCNGAVKPDVLIDFLPEIDCLNEDQNTSFPGYIEGSLHSGENQQSDKSPWLHLEQRSVDIITDEKSDDTDGKGKSQNNLLPSVFDKECPIHTKKWIATVNLEKSLFRQKQNSLSRQKSLQIESHGKIIESSTLNTSSSGNTCNVLTKPHITVKVVIEQANEQEHHDEVTINSTRKDTSLGSQDISSRYHKEYTTNNTELIKQDGEKPVRIQKWLKSVEIQHSHQNAPTSIKKAIANCDNKDLSVKEISRDCKNPNMHKHISDNYVLDDDEDEYCNTKMKNRLLRNSSENGNCEMRSLLLQTNGHENRQNQTENPISAKSFKKRPRTMSWSNRDIQIPAKRRRTMSSSVITNNPGESTSVNDLEVLCEQAPNATSYFTSKNYLGNNLCVDISSVALCEQHSHEQPMRGKNVVSSVNFNEAEVKEISVSDRSVVCNDHTYSACPVQEVVDSDKKETFKNTLARKTDRVKIGLNKACNIKRHIKEGKAKQRRSLENQTLEKKYKLPVPLKELVVICERHIPDSLNILRIPQNSVKDKFIKKFKKRYNSKCIGKEKASVGSARKRRKKPKVPSHYQSIKPDQIKTIKHIDMRYRVAFHLWPQRYTSALEKINQRLINQNAFWKTLE